MKDVRIEDGISECQALDMMISTSSGGNVVMAKGQEEIQMSVIM